MSTASRNIFFVYESEQIPLIPASTPENLVIALDYEVELDLKKNGIPFTSMRELAVPPEGDREVLEFTRRLARMWYISPELSFFQHEGILLGEQHEGLVLYYIQAAVYYLSVIQQILSHIHPARVSIPESLQFVPTTADPTLRFKVRLPVAVSQLLAEMEKIPLTIIPAPPGTRAKEHSLRIRRRALEPVFRTVASVSNLLVTMFQKPRPIKLLVTDPWSRIAPFIKNMPDVELVMTRREEMKAMKWNIWRARARFHHRHDFVNGRIRKTAHEKARAFSGAWKALGKNPTISQEFEYQGVSFWPVVEPLLRSLVEDDSEDAIATIENTKRILQRYGVSCVLLFFSNKGYNSLIARVSERMDIPSIELQHALELSEPSHPYSRLSARYLAAYGSFTKKNYERFGIETERIVECGSPRFDSYVKLPLSTELSAMRQKLGLRGTFLNGLVVVPPIFSFLEHEQFSSYAVENILEDLAELQRENPRIRYILKVRPWNLREHFYEREETRNLFLPQTVLTHYESIRILLALSDIVISGSSTVVLEALMLQKPVVMYVPKVLDKDFQAFEDAGAILMARTKEDLFRHTAYLSQDKRHREELVERGDAFFKKNFMFDGKSSERVAALIRRVAKG